MDRRTEELPELDALSDDALNQLGDRVPAAWLDAATDGGELDALSQAEAGAELDPEELRALLTGLGTEAEERVAARVVDDFLGGLLDRVDGVDGIDGVDGVDGVARPGDAFVGAEAAGPGFVDDEHPRADVIPIASAVRHGPQSRPSSRPWWGAALPLAAAAIVLIVLIDGPGLGAVFDDEGRVRPAELSPNATASAERGAGRAKWSLADVPVPGSVPGGSDAAERAEEEATISVPGGLPGGSRGGAAGGPTGRAKGRVVGGVVGGSLPGAPGGVAGGVPGGVPGGVVGSAQASTSTKEADAAQRRPEVLQTAAVMAHSLYTPDPDPKALASTKAGTFDRRPCASRIRFCVDRSGRSVDVRSVGACYDPKVDQICRDTVKKWRFKPFVVAGEARPVCTEVSFDLRFDKRR